MKLTQNQFYGKKAEMPRRLPPGSTFIAEDENSIYIAGIDGVPVLSIGGNSGNATSDGVLYLSSTITESTNAVDEHKDGMNEVNSSGDVTITIQENSVEDISVGSTLSYNQIGDGKISIAYSGGASGDTGSTFSKTDVITLWHKSLDNWVILSKPNAIDSSLDGEPSGAYLLGNIVGISQANYDAGTPVATTTYIIE
jgi:hypothetical protein